MPHPFELTVQREGDADLLIHGEFSDDEHVTLLQYLKQNDQLVESKPLREGFPCDLTINFDQVTGLEVKTSLPDNDTLSILLHRLRPLILDKEPACFSAVSSVIGKRVKEPHIRRLLREQRQLYDGRDLQRVVKFASNEVIVNSDKVLRDWLNAHEYHRDRDKQQAVDALFKHLPGNLLHGILISMLVDKVRAIQTREVVLSGASL